MINLYAYRIRVVFIFSFLNITVCYRIIKSVSTLWDSGNKVYLQQINIYADYKTVCRR
jgi:hypothetical protein